MGSSLLTSVFFLSCTHSSVLPLFLLPLFLRQSFLPPSLTPFFLYFSFFFFLHFLLFLHLFVAACRFSSVIYHFYLRFLISSFFFCIYPSFVPSFLYSSPFPQSFLFSVILPFLPPSVHSFFLYFLHLSLPCSLFLFFLPFRCLSFSLSFLYSRLVIHLFFLPSFPFAVQDFC